MSTRLPDDTATPAVVPRAPTGSITARIARARLIAVLAYTATALYILVSTAATAAAQTQRLAVPATTLKIPPKKAVTVDAYCLDHALPQPDANTILPHSAASTGGRLWIESGTKQIAPSSAITVRAHEVVLSDVFKDDALRSFGLSPKKWRHKTVSAAAREYKGTNAVFTLFLDEHLGKGDARRISISNNTNQQITVHLDGPVAFSETPLGTFTPPPSLTSTSRIKWSERQPAVWIDAAVAKAESLREPNQVSQDPDSSLLGALRDDTTTYLLHSIGGPTRVSFRGPGGTTTLSGDAALKKYHEVFDTLLQKSLSSTTAIVAHAGLSEGSHGLALRLGTQVIRLSASDAEDLLARQQPLSAVTAELARFDPARPIVVARDGFAQSRGGTARGTSTAPTDATRLLLALQRAYPSRQVYLGAGLSVAEDNLRNTPTITTNSDVAFLTETSVFNVTDHRLVDEIGDHLRNNGIAVVDHAATMTDEMANSLSSSNVILFSGHKDAELVRFIDAIGQRGLLQGKSVGILSCYDSLDSTMASHVISDFGARQVLYLGDAIAAETVKTLLVEAAASQPPGAKTLEDWLRAAVDRASKTAGDMMRLDLQRLRDILIRQLSMVQRNRGLHAA